MLLSAKSNKHRRDNNEGKKRGHRTIGLDVDYHYVGTDVQTNDHSVATRRISNLSVAEGRPSPTRSTFFVLANVRSRRSWFCSFSRTSLQASTLHHYIAPDSWPWQFPTTALCEWSQNLCVHASDTSVPMEKNNVLPQRRCINVHQYNVLSDHLAVAALSTMVDIAPPGACSSRHTCLSFVLPTPNTHHERAKDSELSKCACTHMLRHC